MAKVAQRQVIVALAQAPAALDPADHLDRTSEIVMRNLFNGLVTRDTQSVTSDAFDENMVRILQSIANHIATTLDNARLYSAAQKELAERERAQKELRRVSEEYARRNRELTLLNRVIAATKARLGPTAVLETACRELSLTFDTPRAAVAMLDDERKNLIIKAEYKTASDKSPSALGVSIPVQNNPATQHVLEKAEAEEKLRASEKRHRSISELTSDYIYSVTVTPEQEFLFDWYTDAFLRFTGYTPAELAACGGWLSLIHPDDLHYYKKARARILSSGQAKVGEYRIIIKLWVGTKNQAPNHPAPDTQSLLPNSPMPLYFEVQDTGVGISPDELDRLFDPFVQTARGQDAPEGTGLGLSISQKLVQLMGGEIEVSSQLGEGSHFSFYVQVETVQATDVQTQHTKQRVTGLEADQPLYRILIVKDKWANRKLLVKLLEPLSDPNGQPGFEIREAVNGQEALEIWETWEPHLI